MIFQDLSDIADVRIGDVDSLPVVVQRVERHHHLACRVQGLQGYLTRQEQRLPRTLK